MANRAEYDVPCGGCTLCCHNDMIRLLPEDDSSLYQTVPHTYLSGALMLDHKQNGDCVYLGGGGCTIQETKPLMCKEMDCRKIAGQLGYTQARKMGVIHVWRRGKQLLKAARDAS